MRILITGSLGYVAPSVIEQLRHSYPNAQLLGLDTGYFESCVTRTVNLSTNHLNRQFAADIRDIELRYLMNVDVIVHLAAISNDPMGAMDENLTYTVNYKATVELAKKAKDAGVKRFIFASSCSVYGTAEDGLVAEDSVLNPLTAYAKSKAFSEQALVQLADSDFMITCLRFPTACGMSERLRLDLVLNDFVASAMTTQQINVLSNGTPWRPLINVKDMALAIDWAVCRSGDVCVIINVGTEGSNYQVKDLASAVAERIPGASVLINTRAIPDKRSYKVNFDRFMQLVPSQYHPRCDLKSTINEMIAGLLEMNFTESNFKVSLIRHNFLKNLLERGCVDKDLYWTSTS